jgi:hypothetical protein
LKQLAEDCVTVSHGLNLLSLNRLVVTLPRLIGDSGHLCSEIGRRTPATTDIMSKALQNAVTPSLNSELVQNTCP